MKHLLIVLSFLLSSPVIGDNHKGETLYRWDTSSGIVWRGFGDKEVHSVYKGEVKNGKPNGQGTSTNRMGGKYVGQNDKRNQVTTQMIISSRFQEPNEIGRFVNRKE